jgi:hypothetical protein
MKGELMNSPLAKLSNPFCNTIVSDPWQRLETDVRSIHQNALDLCRRAIDIVRAKHRSTAVLIHGEAGSGKTHLLARLHAYLAAEAEADGPGGLQEAIFVPLLMQTSAQSIWRFLRRQFADALLHKASNGQMQLERLLFHRLAEFLQLPEDNNLWLEKQTLTSQGSTELQQHLSALFDHISAQVSFDYNLRTVLIHLLLHRHRSEASAWLRGEILPQQVFNKLSLGDDQDEEPEELACRIVRELCSLATGELPIIFCFDQVEALQTHPQDVAGLFAFGNVAWMLHDKTRHSLLISCIQSAFLDKLRDTVRDANWDRLTEASQNLVSLNPLTWEEAEQLVKARLDAEPDLKELRKAHTDPLWPLSEAAIKTGFTQTGISARKLLVRCAELFDAIRLGTPGLSITPLSNQQFLQQEWESRKEHALAHHSPKDTDTLLNEGLQRLIPLARRDWQQLVENKPRDLDLVFTDKNKRIGISLCNSTHWPSLVRKLERLDQLPPQQKPDKLVLLRDQRLPIGTNATRTKQQRERLVQGGAIWTEPSPECLAALAALRVLLSEASAGDLANNGDTVGVETVRDWLLNNLSAELQSLVEEILPSHVPLLDDTRERLAEFLQRHHVARLTDAADLLGLESAAVSACALNYPDRFGTLGNPPAVLFELVNEVALS